jgi:hypothetical protein
MKILCWLGFHKYYEWFRRNAGTVLLVRACEICGKYQFQTGSPDGRLYWIDFEENK